MSSAFCETRKMSRITSSVPQRPWCPGSLLNTQVELTLPDTLYLTLSVQLTNPAVPCSVHETMAFIL